MQTVGRDKEVGASPSYAEVTARAQAVLSELSDAIGTMDELLAKLSAYSGDTGSMSSQHTALSGRRVQPQGSVAYDVGKDHAGVLQGLSKLRKRYARLYPYAFSALDDKALLDFGCLGVVDLFESDLYARVKEARSRLSSVYVRRKASLDAMVAGATKADEMLPGLSAVRDPALSRYLKQDPASTATLLRDLDDIADRRRLVAERNLAELPKTPPGATGVDSQAYYLTAAGITDVNDQAQLDKASCAPARSPRSKAVAAISDWSDEILRAQYPVSLSFCPGEEGESPETSSRDPVTAAALASAREDAERRKASSSGEGNVEVERYIDNAKLPEAERRDNARKALDRALYTYQRLLNRLDVPTGRTDGEDERAYEARSYRTALARLRAEARATSSPEALASLCAKVDSMSTNMAARLSAEQ